MRAKRKIPQAGLAELTDVSRQRINGIETGEYGPGLPLTFELESIFGKKIEEIFFP
ncbi:MAG: helix-turn-helix domain-containing protein [Emcibacter sp.]|nr:helix-turn-helix domain-containing protein [Emcibacter sp.]